MGLFNSMANYAHKAELRESKDEILVGEIIRSLSHRGWRCCQIVAHSDRQQVAFKLPGDEVLSRVTVMVDRRSGSGALTQSLGSRTIVSVSAETRNEVADPDDLAAMWRTDLANLFKLPVQGEVRLNHQLNKVTARTFDLVDLDQMVQGHQVNAAAFVDWLVSMTDNLREQLRPHKK